MAMVEYLSQFVESIVKRLVEKPEEVKVSTTTSTKSVIVQIKSEKSDTGIIIGKKGRIIHALRVLVSAIKNTQFTSDPRRLVIEVLEDENSQFARKRDAKDGGIKNVAQRV